MTERTPEHGTVDRYDSGCRCDDCIVEFARYRDRILDEVRAEKGGYLRGKGWTEPQIEAYLSVGTIGWRPPWWMNSWGRKQRVA